MSLGQVNSGFNLLGQGGAATAARMAPIPAPEPPAIEVEPKLEIPWGDFHQGFASSVRAFFSRPFFSKDFLGSEYFRDCWIERRIPKRAVFAAALWHAAILLMPFSLFTAALRHNPAFDNTQLTWSGPINDFPLVEIRAAKPKVAAHDPLKPLPPKGADAFHPRQRIITDPVHPTHPRQTVINPAAPQLAPKVLTDLPNIVQLQAPVAPARPRIQISQDALAKLHARQHRVAATTTAPPPDVAPSLDPKPAEIALALSPNAPARPKMDLNAGAAPRVAVHAQTGDSAPAPELGASHTASTSGAPASLIALSAAPAPPAPNVQPPQGNLAARVSISPEGTKRGVPDGSPNGTGDPSSSSSGGGNSAVGVSISGGNPQPKSTVSGLGGAKLNLPSARSLMSRPDANDKSQDAQERTGPPNFATLPPGAKPEQIFAAKHVYTLAINMANLNSASGSWILNFSELGSGVGASATADLASPLPIRKVDPKYPPELIEQNVQGEVVLYGIIRANGAVDSIQIVRGVDPQLDANAKSAFAQWKFTPASRSGTPVEIEVIAHIPFKIRDDR